MASRPYKFDLSHNYTDINIFKKEFEERVLNDLKYSETGDFSCKSPFLSFAEKNVCVTDDAWLQDNEERFFEQTTNEKILKSYYLSDLGFIFCMLYSPDGEYIIVGYSTGLVQASLNHDMKMDEINAILSTYADSIQNYYDTEDQARSIWYPLFYNEHAKQKSRYDWIKQNYDTFLKGTTNEILYNRWYHSQSGYVTAMEYSRNGSYIIVGHSTGLIQMHHGRTGAVMCTLRSVQFPPKPIYALEFHATEERVCYAACMDGAVYRIDIPCIPEPVEDEMRYGIKANPGLDCLSMQFYAAPGSSASSTPFVTQRSPALSLGITADETNLVVGYGDASVKVYDMNTQEVTETYKVHKLRLQFIPKKLQRMHAGQVCALKCHDERPFVFASAAWDNTVRIWDVRCQVGCMMTFEGVNVCSNSIDLKRNFCIVGSWQTTEALTVWDIIAKKQVSIVRVQNRRPDVDGEYIYACRFWNSHKYNRKAKYGIIGGSGTNCVEVINLHNRYITCSYPAEGTVLAVTSHEDLIAFGGTAPVFSIVSFHDPKHEEYAKEISMEYTYRKGDDVVLYEGDNESLASVETEISQVPIM